MEVLSGYYYGVQYVTTSERTPPVIHPKTPSDRDVCRSGIPAGPNVAMTWAAGATCAPLPPGAWRLVWWFISRCPVSPVKGGMGPYKELASGSPATSFFPERNPVY